MNLWFKHIRLLALNEAIPFHTEALNQQCEQLRFTPCPRHLPMSLGFVSPFSDNGEEALVYGFQNCLLVRLRIEERVVPARVLREQLTQKIQLIETQEGRKIYAAEKVRLKDDLYQTLLSQAFSHSTYVMAYVDTVRNWVLINTTAKRRVTAFISAFQKVTQRTLVAPTLQPTHEVLTHWLLNTQPPPLSVLNHCVLKGIEPTTRTARFKALDLNAPRIQAFLDGTLSVTQLALQFGEHCSFTLKEDLHISSIKFSETLKETIQLDAQDAEAQATEELKLAAQFMLMTDTFSTLLTALMPHFMLEQAVAVA